MKQFADEWEKKLGMPLATLVSLYTAVKKVWAKMKVGPKILHWLLSSTEGNFCLQSNAEIVGKKYLAATDRDARRFKVVKVGRFNNNYVKIEVDQDAARIITGTFPNFVESYYDSGKGIISVQIIGDKVYIGNRELLLFNPTEASEKDCVINIFSKNIAEEDGVSAIFLDCLLEHKDFFPKRFYKSNQILVFTGTIYKKLSGNTSHSFRALYHDGSEVLVEKNDRWFDYFRVAKLGPEEDLSLLPKEVINKKQLLECIWSGNSKPNHAGLSPVFLHLWDGRLVTGSCYRGDGPAEVDIVEGEAWDDNRLIPSVDKLLGDKKSFSIATGSGDDVSWVEWTIED